MTKDILKELPDVLKRHSCALQKASKDKNTNEAMCNSKLKVIDFDKIPREYVRGKGWPSLPASNDALYISKDKSWYFIEFKNGSIDKSQIFRKIYDSLIMLIELNIIKDLDFARQNMQYILVYNSDKFSNLKKSESLERSHSYFFERAKHEEKLFNVDNFEKYLFKEVHTYTKEMFNEKFVEPMERDEGFAEASPINS